MITTRVDLHITKMLVHTSPYTLSMEKRWSYNSIQFVYEKCYSYNTQIILSMTKSFIAISVCVCCQVTVLVTCITMGLLAADRFLVFCHPMTALQYRQPKVALLANLSVWICKSVCFTGGLVYR